MILEIENETVRDPLIKRLAKMGFQTTFHGVDRLAIIRGIDSLVRPELFIALPGVKRVLPLKEKHKLASCHSRNGATVIEVGGR